MTVAVIVLILIVQIIRFMLSNLLIFAVFIIPPILFTSGVYLLVTGNFLGVIALLLSLILILKRKSITHIGHHWRHK